MGVLISSFRFDGIEMNRWFVDHWNPWFRRGHAFHGGLGAGVNAFNHENGHAWLNDSFRVVHYYYDNIMSKVNNCLFDFLS